MRMLGRTNTNALLVAAGLVVMLAAGGTLALAATLPPGGTFFDDDASVHEGAIEAIAAEGITRGCNPPTNSLFCPDADVTRGAMAAFLSRSLDLPASTEDYFSDDEGSVFEEDINRLAAAGITKGCNPPANDLYCPGATVTREQMAAFLTRALGYGDGAGVDLFLDDNGSLFEPDIDRLGTAGVTKGCNPPDNDLFCPTETVKRDQMASFLSRALELPAIVPPPRPTTTTTTTSPRDGCDPSYPTVCIPPKPPDLNCPDIPYTDFRVLQPDPHRFDGDKDGWGCETTDWP